MAGTKVRSAPSNYARRPFGNDASSVASLELRDESPPEYCFDNVLNDFGLNLDKQYCDESALKIRDNNCKASRNLFCLISNEDIGVLDILQGVEATAGSDKNVCLKLESVNSMAPTINCITGINAVSLSALAENHLKSDKYPHVLNDSCVDLDSALTDLLCDIAETSICSKPSTSTNGSNFSGLSFSSSNDCLLKKLEAEPAHEVIDDDLTVLLESCDDHHLQPSSSSNINFFNSLPNNLNGNFKENASAFVNNCEIHEDPNFELSENLENILSGEKLYANISNPVISISDNSNYGKYGNEALKRCDNVLSSNDSDDEIVPDIDLNFCFKKSKNKNVFSDSFTIVKSSPESTDSGFDEAEFGSSKSSPTFKDFLLFENASEKEFISALTNPKPTLFSKSISCKPKTDKTRSEKIKNIKRDLFKKYFPSTFIDCNQQNIPKVINNKLDDQSNQCIMKVNGYLKVGDQ